MLLCGFDGCFRINNYQIGRLYRHSYEALLHQRLRGTEREACQVVSTSTVLEYKARFEAITNETIYLPPSFLAHCFISSLQADIKHAVLASWPTDLEEAITLAHLHEQRIALEKGSTRPTIGCSQPLLSIPKIML